MKIDLDRLENIERAVIYIKTHEKRIIVSGKEHVLISAALWEHVQKALAESESESESESEVDDNASYVEEFKKPSAEISFRTPVASTKRTDAEGESHDHYEIGTYVLLKTVDGFRVGLVIGNAGVGYSTVALFEQWVAKEIKWLKAEIRSAVSNTMLTFPCSTEIANPCRLTAHHLKTLTSFCGIKVKTKSHSKKISEYGYVVGTARYYLGVPTQVYVATLNEPSKPGRIHTASVGNLQRADGTLLKPSLKGKKK